MRLSPVLSRRAIDINEERRTVVNAMSWVLRGLLGVGGAVAGFRGLAGGQWRLAGAEGRRRRLRAAQPARRIDLASVQAGIAALDRAVAADPVAGRRLGRSELSAGAALTPDLPVDQGAARRMDEAGAGRPRLRDWATRRPAASAGRGLAAARQALDGTSAKVVAALMRSIDVAPMMNRCGRAACSSSSTTGSISRRRSASASLPTWS